MRAMRFFSSSAQEKVDVGTWIRLKPYQRRESMICLHVEVEETATIKELKEKICQKIQNSSNILPEDKEVYRDTSQIAEITDSCDLCIYKDNTKIFQLKNTNPMQH